MPADIFHLSTDNEVVWQLLEKSVPVNHAAITRYVLTLDLQDGSAPVVIDSDIEDTLFVASADQVSLSPVQLSNAVKDELMDDANYMAKLKVYDAGHANGIDWFSGRSIKVVK